MRGKKLEFSDMRAGDVLLFEDVTGAATHFGIAAGQAVVSHRSLASSNVTHAGLYDGASNILESSGQAGLRSMPLVTKHPGSKYQVFRVLDDMVSRHANNWAEKLINHRPDDKKNPAQKSEGFGRYGTSMATKGLFSRSKRGNGAKAAENRLISDPMADRAFYCSNFVVECFILACDTCKTAPVINADYRKVSPKLLQAELRGSGFWRYLGNYQVGN